MAQTIKVVVFDHPFEMAGENLKYKYRCRRPVSGHGSSSNRSGSKPRGTVPLGMRRRYRGKTTFK